MELTRQPGRLTRRSLLRVGALGLSAIAAEGLLAACGPAAAPAATSAAATPLAPAPASTATTAAQVAAPTAAAGAATATTASQGAAATATTAPAVTSTTSSAKVALKVFNRGHPLNELVKGAADEYQVAHPNVTIDWQSAPPGEDMRKMLVLAAAGNSPDIQWQCLLCDYLQFVLAGLYLEHDDLIKSTKYPVDTQLASAMAGARYQGKLYGLPNASHPSYPAVCINKTMFEKAGVPIPKEEWTTGAHPGWKSWTFDAMRSAAVSLTKRSGGRVQQWGLQVSGYDNPFDVVMQAVRSEGSDFFNEDGTKLQWNDSVGRKVVRYFADLYTKDKVAPITPDMPTGGPDLMASGRVGIRYAPIWHISTSKETFKDFEWMMLPAPLGAAGSDGNAEANYFSVMKVTKQPEIAFDLLTKIIDPKWGWAAVAKGGIPGSQKEFWAPDSKLSADPSFAIFARMMNTVSANRMPINGRRDELETAWTAGMDPIWLGQDTDTDKLIDQLTPKLQAIMDSKPATLDELAKPKAGAEDCDCATTA